MKIVIMEKLKIDLMSNMIAIKWDLDLINTQTLACFDHRMITDDQTSYFEHLNKKIGLSLRFDFAHSMD